MEEWKDVRGFKGLYEVSNLGRVRDKNGLLKEYNTDGYIRVCLKKTLNGKRISRCIGVHRLVAQAFIPNPHRYKEVNHKDENKSNNCVDNLEWCTRKYNVNYGTRTQRAAEAKRRNTEIRKVNSR